MKKTEFKMEDVAYCPPVARTIGVMAYALCEASSAEHEGVEEDGEYEW